MGEGPGRALVEVTRIYRFSAAHRMHNPRLSAEENARLYGRCNHPTGHGHSYRLGVTLRGPIHSDTGCVADLEGLDRLVEERLLARLHLANLDEIIEARDGVTSTTEALLALCWRLLEAGLPPGRLWRLRVEETPNNSFELARAGGARAGRRGGGEERA